MTFTLLLFDSAVCLPFNNENELNLKHSGKAELRTTSDTTGLKQHVHQEVVKITSNNEVEKETRKKEKNFKLNFSNAFIEFFVELVFSIKKRLPDFFAHIQRQSKYFRLILKKGNKISAKNFCDSSTSTSGIQKDKKRKLNLEKERVCDTETKQTNKQTDDSPKELKISSLKKSRPG